MLAANDRPLQVQEQMASGGVVFSETENKFVFKLNPLSKTRISYMISVGQGAQTGFGGAGAGGSMRGGPSGRMPGGPGGPGGPIRGAVRLSLVVSLP